MIFGSFCYNVIPVKVLFNSGIFAWSLDV